MSSLPLKKQSHTFCMYLIKFYRKLCNKIRHQHHMTMSKDIVHLFQVLRKCNFKFDCSIYAKLCIRDIKQTLNTQTDTITANVYLRCYFNVFINCIIIVRHHITYTLLYNLLLQLNSLHILMVIVAGGLVTIGEHPQPFHRQD